MAVTAQCAPERILTISPEQLLKKVELEIKVGLNLQRDQPVMIAGDKIHEPYFKLITEQCKRLGCGEIYYDRIDRTADRRFLESCKGKSSITVDRDVQGMYEAWERKGGARIFVESADDPTVFQGIDPELVNTYEEKCREARAAYFQRVAMTDEAQWCVIPQPTSAWAAMIFPGVDPEEQLSRLTHAIHSSMYLYDEDPVATWQKKLATLSQRAEFLNNAQIKTLHCIGEGTDLTIGFTPTYRFLSGAGVSKKGVPFIANMPTEEIYSAPNNTIAEGYARIVRAVMINSTRVSGLVLTFKNGEVVDFSAEEGGATFAAYLKTDPGARRLGEIGLVGDSAVGKLLDHRGMPISFQETLLDEQSGVHIALGAGYEKCRTESVGTTEESRAAHGFNFSNVHDDLVIGDDKLSVIATTVTGHTFTVIDRGRWAEIQS